MAAIGLGLFGALPLLAVLWAAFMPVPATPLMGLRLLEGETWRQSWRSLDEISPNLPLAVLAAEDNAFCQHHGIDWAAVATAVKEVDKGKRDAQRGASTLSMQVAKNLLLWPDRDPLRKGLELVYVTWIEGLWPKRRIVEVYLNIVEWAPGIYGAEAAAQHHFGVSAAKLSARQAALLAAVLPNPRKFNAGKPSGYINERAGQLQRRMEDVRALADCLK
ncbi:MAG TPA: monofunctional biosynthetic peptidoglycan transglycosylase [Kiloniellales bacterium]|nr:monofunctional biosynthetic peptidoglycan transglycosylase [Kiloniellales bacterium]